MTDIRIFRDNEKLDEAYEILVEKMNLICKQFQLNYYELFGLLECYRSELYKNLEEENIKGEGE